MKLSVIVPCYNEEKTVNKFYYAAKPVLDELNEDYEIIFVNDGSKDKTGLLLAGLAFEDKKVKVVEFSRNFGQTPAILCGLKYATGDCAVEMDCDLQDPVEVVPLMVEKWKEGYEVVHGRRSSRKGESIFKRVTASLYYKFLSKISDAEIPRNTGEFKLIDRKVIDIILSLPEHDKYLRGLESWVGFKQTFVDFERKKRVAGETHYSLKKMLKLAKAGIVSNSTYPLKISLRVGALTVFSSLCAFVVFIVLACIGKPLPLVAWLFPTIAFFFGTSFIFNYITNLYVARINEETKCRPDYIVAETINLGEE